VGSVLLVLNGAMNHPDQNYYYAILVIIASICYAINVKLNQKVLSDLSPLSITTGNFLVLLFPSLAILYFTGFSDVVQVEKYKCSFIYYDFRSCGN
jgi:drug/metabolite transporter (DMT)-like permease